MWNIWATWSNRWQSYENDYNDHIVNQMIIRTCKQKSTIIYGWKHVQHINMMRWEKQRIDTKSNSKHHKEKQENKHNVKQTEQGFLIKYVFSPLAYASPLWNFPSTNVHEFNKLSSILSSIIYIYKPQNH